MGTGGFIMFFYIEGTDLHVHNKMLKNLWKILDFSWVEHIGSVVF